MRRMVFLLGLLLGACAGSEISTSRKGEAIAANGAVYRVTWVSAGAGVYDFRMQREENTGELDAVAEAAGAQAAALRKAAELCRGRGESQSETKDGAAYLTRIECVAP